MLCHSARMGIFSLVTDVKDTLCQRVTHLLVDSS